MILDTINTSTIDAVVANHAIDVIVSDVFDTLLCRKVHPEHIKRIVAARLSDLFETIPASAFYAARQRAEAFCYEQSKAVYGDTEIYYPSMIATMHRMLFDTYGDSFFMDKPTFYLHHRHIELTTECRNLSPDTALSQCLRQHKYNGKKVILLSDFYMDSEWLEYLLEYHHLQDCYDHLVVSADVLKTKRSGQLYQYLLDIGLITDPEHTLMIGDNVHSDIRMASTFHLKTFLIDRPKQRQFYDEQQAVGLSKKTLISTLNALIHAPEDQVFEHMPLLLLKVIRMLYADCIKRGVKDLYFLSREGKIVHDLFNTYQAFLLGSHVGHPRITTHYLLVSRRSTAAASLGPLVSEDFNTLFRQYVKLSIKQFSLSYGFDLATIALFCKALNIDMEVQHDHLPSSPAFNQLKQYPDFITYYDAARAMQRDNFLTYFNNLSVAPDQDLIYLFDVGWKGSIQDNLSKLFPERMITGFYIGLSAPGAMTEMNQKKGLLFDYRKKDKAYWIYKENTALFEVLLNASHGSIKHYIREATGGIRIEFDEDQQEQQCFVNKIATIQQNICTQYEKILLSFDTYAISIKAMDGYLLKLHQLKLFSPNKKETQWFSDIQHFENFGLFTYSQFSYQETQSLVKRMKNLMLFIRSPGRFFSTACWPSSTLSQHGLSFVIPFYKWYSLYFKRLLHLYR